MADKTTDQYYDRLEALIDKILKVGETLPFETILTGFIEHPERYGSLLSALYRSRSMVTPGKGHTALVHNMPDSEIEDSLVTMMREMGYEVTVPTSTEQWERKHADLLAEQEAERDRQVVNMGHYSRRPIK